MRLNVIALIGWVCMSAACHAGVQVSNMNQSDWGLQPIPQDVSPGGPIANGFTTGPGNAWLLKSVSLKIEYFGIGYTDLWVQLRSFTPGFGPGGVVEQLAHYTIGPGPQDLVVQSSGTVLQPSTQYYIVLFTNPTAVDLRVTEDNAECSASGWVIEDYAVFKNFGFWYALGARSFRMSIDADALIPPPIVTSVTGCNDISPVTIACPNSGGVQLVVNGQNFRPGAVVLVGGIPASNTILQSSTQISCILPPGAGRNQAVTVVDGSSVGLLANGVSYFAPACPGDANGDGAVNFADIGAVLASFTAACP